MGTYAEEIKSILLEGPHTNEELRRALAKRGVFASNDTVRKICIRALELGEIEKVTVVTKQHRNGIAVWSRVGEDPVKVITFVDALKSIKAKSFQFGR